MATEIELLQEILSVLKEIQEDVRWSVDRQKAKERALTDALNQATAHLRKPE